MAQKPDAAFDPWDQNDRRDESEAGVRRFNPVALAARLLPPSEGESSFNAAARELVAGLIAASDAEVIAGIMDDGHGHRPR